MIARLRDYVFGHDSDTKPERAAKTVSAYLRICFCLRCEPVDPPHFAEHRPEGQREPGGENPGPCLTDLREQGRKRRKNESESQGVIMFSFR